MKKIFIFGILIFSFFGVDAGVWSNIWVDKGCGAIYYGGEPITIYFQTTKDTTKIEIWDEPPGGVPQLMYTIPTQANVLYYFFAVVVPPTGTEKLTLKAWGTDATYEEDICIFYVSEMLEKPEFYLATWVDKGCGGTYLVGEKVTITIVSSLGANIEIWEARPNGKRFHQTDLIMSAGKTTYGYVLKEEIYGERKIVLEAYNPTFGIFQTAECEFYVLKEYPKPQILKPDIYLEQSFDKDVVLVGEDVDLQVLAKNIGNSVAKNSYLEVLLPQGMEFVSGTSEWRGDIAPNETISLKIVLKGLEKGSYTVNFKIIYQDEEGNSFTESSFIVLEVLGLPEILIEKEVVSEKVKVGDRVFVVVTARNVGDSVAREVLISDSVPQDFEVFGALEWEGEIDAGNAAVLTYEISPKKAGSFDLPQAKASYKDDTGNSYSTKSNTARIEVKGKLGFEIYYIVLIFLSALILKKLFG